MKNEYEIRGDITAIFLAWEGNIHETIIDTTDLELATNTWCEIMDHSGMHYVVGRVQLHGKRVRYQLHRWILGTTDPEVQVDHKYHDNLDNRRQNLREVTGQQNSQNRKGACITSKSGIRGVCWSKKRNMWVAKVGVNGKVIHLGFYVDIQDATQAVIKARDMYLPYSVERDNNAH